jgi:hypothetical protein
MPYRRGGTQYSKTDFSVKTFAKPLKQGTPVVPRDHNSDHAGPAQNLTIISPTVLPLNPFQSFCFARSRQRLLAPTTPKKVSTAKKTILNKAFSDQRMDTTDSDSLVLNKKLQYLKMKASVSIYEAQCVVLPVPSPVVSTCCAVDSTLTKGLKKSVSTIILVMYSS